ncbi:uncharacterized protein G2W53_017883 [Senna tora]|uniref:Uncharacterized protein n=1 Tax=Senna tora TaxID=362788 RepID=A0A834TS22_9FABA|nr:uncharacterized protein G2W53_017883 [Senna tora]
MADLVVESDSKLVIDMLITPAVTTLLY